MAEIEQLEAEKAADQRQRVRRLHEAAVELATKVERPTVEEVEASLQLAKELPVPNFGEWFEVEKERNTERYQEAVEETSRMLGTHEAKTRLRILKEILLNWTRRTSLAI
jgi:hypothetical protein